jgi:PAS domain S-box-containing protein
MSFVSGHFLADFLQTLDGHGLDVDALLGDLPVRWMRTDVRNALVEWDLFVELIRRLERRAGGEEGLEHLGELMADMKPSPVLRRMAGLSASPVALYQASLRWGLPRAFPHLRSSLASLPDGRLRITSVVDQSDQPCPQLFRLALGAVRALPRILNLPDAVASAEISGRYCELTITPPPSGTLLARGRRGLLALFSARAALHQLQLQQLERQMHFDALRRSYAELKASEARQRALSDSLVDILAELDADARFVFVSPSIQELTGYVREQVVGSNLSLWLHRDDAPAMRALFSRILREGRTPVPSPVIRMRHEQGHWIRMEITARSFTAHDGDRHVVASLRDVGSRVDESVVLHRQQEELVETLTERTQQLERINHDLRDLQKHLLTAEDETPAADQTQSPDLPPER